MLNKTVRDIVENYSPKEEEFIDISNLAENLLVDGDEELDESDVENIIDDITSLYNESDEETQDYIDDLLEEEDGLETLVSMIYEDDEEDDEEEEETDLSELKMPSTFTKLKHKIIYGQTPKETAKKVASSTSVSYHDDKSIKNADDKTLNDLKGGPKDKPSHGSPRHMQIRAIDRELKKRAADKPTVSTSKTSKH